MVLMAWLGLGCAGLALAVLGQSDWAGPWLAGLGIGWALARPGLARLAWAWARLTWPGEAWLDLDCAGVAVLGPGGPELSGAWLGLGWGSWGGLSRNLSCSIKKKRIAWLGLAGRWRGLIGQARACAGLGLALAGLGWAGLG